MRQQLQQAPDILPSVMLRACCCCCLLQLHTMLSSQSMKLAIASGQQGDWSNTLGALRLSKVLGASANSLSDEQTAQLQQLRQQAVANNGTAAHLFCEALGKLLPAQ